MRCRPSPTGPTTSSHRGRIAGIAFEKLLDKTISLRNAASAIDLISSSSFTASHDSKDLRMGPGDADDGRRFAEMFLRGPETLAGFSGTALPQDKLDEFEVKVFRHQQLALGLAGAKYPQGERRAESSRRLAP